MHDHRLHHLNRIYSVNIIPFNILTESFAGHHIHRTPLGTSCPSLYTLLESFCVTSTDYYDTSWFIVPLGRGRYLAWCLNSAPRQRHQPLQRLYAAIHTTCQHLPQNKSTYFSWLPLHLKPPLAASTTQKQKFLLPAHLYWWFFYLVCWSFQITYGRVS